MNSDMLRTNVYTSLPFLSSNLLYHVHANNIFLFFPPKIYKIKQVKVSPIVQFSRPSISPDWFLYRKFYFFIWYFTIRYEIKDSVVGAITPTNIKNICLIFKISTYYNVMLKIATWNRVLHMNISSRDGGGGQADPATAGPMFWLRITSPTLCRREARVSSVQIHAGTNVTVRRAVDTWEQTDFERGGHTFSAGVARNTVNTKQNSDQLACVAPSCGSPGDWHRR